MSIPRHLRAAALVAAAVLLGLLTVQGSYALWSAAAAAAPGTVTSASFDVNLAGAPSNQLTSMTVAGTPANLAVTTQSIPLAALMPGTAVYASITATNNSDAGGQFNISVTSGAPVLTNAGGGSLATYLTVSAKSATSAATCGTTGYTGLTPVTVPKGASTTLCFEVRLASNAPAAVKGQAVSISIPLTATQLCGVPSGCA
ncbi:hypothetical protein [Arthrobacter sp. QXT-31]|uniref:hypothetical protein n=1 Tax=Arthrobacter sp. QXT-31 TaxID=1357915 RepID=UPI0009718AEF|nr:hypothetical protein [Arthrobacter sp. QXT-31]APX01284.1 hypothetical protein BWQ92_05685 [Arthrobacter sp. QXT-31]